MTRPYKKKPATERFWARVDVRGPQDCWLWQGSTGAGYGKFEINNKLIGTHQLSYMWAHGLTELPKFTKAGLKVEIMHSCDVALCVNPAHLTMGDTALNARDKVAKGRHPLASRTHCKNGHEYTVENTSWVNCRSYVAKDGTPWKVRHCRACKRDMYHRNKGKK
jgi:hypothetical protein